MRSFVIFFVLGLFLSACSHRSPSELIAQAEKLRESEKYDDAHRTLLTLLERDDLSQRERAVALKEVGNIFLLGEKNYEQAENYYRKSLTVEPDYINSVHNLGLIYLKRFEDSVESKTIEEDQRENLDQATKYFQDALSLNPHFALSLEELSKIHFYKKDYGKAIEFIEKAKSETPRNPRAFIIEGQIYLKGKKDPVKAFTVFEEAYTLNRDNLVLLYYLAQTSPSISEEKGKYYNTLFNDKKVALEKAGVWTTADQELNNLKLLSD